MAPGRWQPLREQVEVITDILTDSPVPWVLPTLFLPDMSVIVPESVFMVLITGYGRLYCDYHGWGGEFPKTQISWAKQLEISSADSEMCYWYMKSLDYCKNSDNY